MKNIIFVLLCAIAAVQCHSQVQSRSHVLGKIQEAQQLLTRYTNQVTPYEIAYAQQRKKSLNNAIKLLKVVSKLLDNYKASQTNTHAASNTLQFGRPGMPVIKMTPEQEKAYLKEQSRIQDVAAIARASAQKPNTYEPPAGPVDTRTCWKAGAVCWDNMGTDSCVLNCCSGNYRQDKNIMKDVCTAEAPCFTAGTSCGLDRSKANSCYFQCCSGSWQEYQNGKGECNGEGAKFPAVVAYAGTPDKKMQQTLIIGSESCFRGGETCEDDNGPSSCWNRCCSKKYHYDSGKRADVCDPIPADNKCYAQYTPCWNANPVPAGKSYRDPKTGISIDYPSCFDCCARITATKKAHWPAWTEYYIESGKRTSWWDPFRASFEAVNPVQVVFDLMIPKEKRLKRGGEVVKDFVIDQITNLPIKEVQGRVAKLVAGKAAGAVSTAFDALFAFFSAVAEPQWDMCD